MKLMDKKFSLTKNNGEVVKEINITELAVIPEWWEDEEDFDEDSFEENILGAYLNINEKDEITIPVDEKGNVSVDGIRDASTKNVEDHPIFDELFDDWREVTFDNVTTI
jgi:hypothetical protein